MSKNKDLPKEHEKGVEDSVDNSSNFPVEF